MRILIAMLPELGHMNPTFRIARTLQSRGHEVRYLAVADVVRHVVSQGFEPVRHLEDLQPEGSLDRVHSMSKFELRRHRTQAFEQLTEAFLDERMRDVLREAKPELMLIDVCHSLMAFLARQLAIPSIALSTALPQTRDSGVPPQRSGMMFEAGFTGRAKARLEWEKFVAKRKIAANMMAPLGMCPPYELALKAAPKFGIAPEVPIEQYPMYMPQLLEPTELVLCPGAFDFPRPETQRRRYVESFDRQRKDTGTFPWEQIDANKPLVYCSMSSQKYRPGAVAKFFARVVEVFRKRPEWQLILSHGPHTTAAELAPIPANVVVVPRAPQLEILARTKAMITHGGLGSVKEAIMAGVPMIVFPLDVDQPGNAARVEYHGIGSRGELETTTREQLDSFLARALEDRSVREAIARMQAKFVAVEAADGGADLIEASAKGRA